VNDGGSAILWIMAGSVLGSYLLVGGMFWYVRRRSHIGIAKRLARGQRVSISVRGDRPAWGRSKPLGAGQGVRQVGTAMYWLDEAGLVHLDFVPLLPKASDAHGSLHLSGPMPEDVGSGLTRSARAWWALGLPPAALICGLIAGYVLSAGSGASRLGTALLWGVLLFLGVWIPVHVLVLVRGARRPR